MDPHKPSWAGKRILVTGCSRFLGQAIARSLLERDATVVGLIGEREESWIFSNEQRQGRFRIARGRPEDTFRVHTTLAVHEIEAVFHLADVGLTSNQSSSVEAQERSLGTILRAVKLYNPRLPIITSRMGSHVRLKAPDGPQQFIPVGIARFGELFGNEGPEVSRVVSRTIANLLSSRNVSPSDLPRRDFVFVRDAAEACVLVAEELLEAKTPVDRFFQSGWLLNDDEMTEQIRAVFAGTTFMSRNAEVPGNPHGWAPSTTLCDALAECIEYQRSQPQVQVLRTSTRNTSRKAA
jgi:nucleoside-diphosphate-sugar epimerase